MRFWVFLFDKILNIFEVLMSCDSFKFVAICEQLDYDIMIK